MKEVGCFNQVEVGEAWEAPVGGGGHREPEAHREGMWREGRCHPARALTQRRVDEGAAEWGEEMQHSLNLRHPSLRSWPGTPTAPGHSRKEAQGRQGP